MLRHIVAAGVDREMLLYWGVRTERDLYATAMIDDLRRQNARLTYVPVLSESDGASGVRRRGLVHAAVLEDFTDLSAFDVYASGPPQLIAAVRRDLPAHGVDIDNLSFDSFDYAADSAASTSM
jgi:CDP-4-dehydro-6-deoxyglucose reductase, E3